MLTEPNALLLSVVGFSCVFVHFVHETLWMWFVLEFPAGLIWRLSSVDLSCKQTEDRQLFVNNTHPDRLSPFLFPSVTGLSISNMTGEAEEEEEEEGDGEERVKGGGRVEKTTLWACLHSDWVPPSSLAGPAAICVDYTLKWQFNSERLNVIIRHPRMFSWIWQHLQFSSRLVQTNWERIISWSSDCEAERALDRSHRINWRILSERLHPWLIHSSSGL